MNMNELLLRVMLKSVPEKFLRTLWYSHHGRVQSRKFYKLCFPRREYYEQPSPDEQPDKKTKERNVSSKRAAEEVCFRQIPFPWHAAGYNSVSEVTSNVDVMTAIMITTISIT